MKTTDILMIVAIFAVGLASMNLMITLNKIGDFKSLTGRAQSIDTGTANLTITSNTEINFSYDDKLDWGSGWVTGGETECELTSYGIMNCSGFTNISDGLVIINVGNDDVHLNLSASKSATDFIAAGAVFQWNVSNNESRSCANTGQIPYRTNISYWADAELDNDNRACDNFTWHDTRDELEIGLRIVIPSTAAKEAKGVTITAIADTYA